MTAKIIIDANDAVAYHTHDKIWEQVPLPLIREVLDPHSIDCGWMPAVVRYISPEVRFFGVPASLVVIECPPARHTVRVRFCDSVCIDEDEDEWDETWSTEMHTINVPWHSWFLYAIQNNDGTVSFLANFNLLFQKTQAFSEDTLFYPPFLSNVYADFHLGCWNKTDWEEKRIPIVTVEQDGTPGNTIYGYSICDMGRVCFGGTGKDTAVLTDLKLAPYDSLADAFAQFVTLFWTSSFYAGDYADGIEEMTGTDDRHDAWNQVSQWTMEEAHNVLKSPYYTYGQLIEAVERLAAPVGLTQLFAHAAAAASKV